MRILLLFFCFTLASSAWISFTFSCSACSHRTACSHHVVSQCRRGWTLWSSHMYEYTKNKHKLHAGSLYFMFSQFQNFNPKSLQLRKLKILFEVFEAAKMFFSVLKKYFYFLHIQSVDVHLNNSESDLICSLLSTTLIIFNKKYVEKTNFSS